MAITPSRVVEPFPLDRRPRPRNQVLNSWKEIAAYLKCGVRTAQRWERDLQLPVYRPRPGKRGPVCAFPSELQIWLHRNPQTAGGNFLVDATRRNLTIAAAHELTRQSHQLVRITAANTRIQKEHAARLLKTIEILKSRIQWRKNVGGNKF